ncbi:methyl-CpG-binding domain-containing protein 5 [Gossypium hirsutum]|uniref:Methyl-CpG-binding domain-containing protein 5 n=2 Tax=Gossypium TaxID=3633 RepID=A0ABM3AD03_GOSHI|nr:methyl-CpG-binding domain-containing protein 5-like [Gossypium hirsutum]
MTVEYLVFKIVSYFFILYSRIPQRKYLFKDKFDFYLKVVLAFNRNQLAESPKSPNDSISCGTLLDTPPQGSNNLSFSTESKVKQRGVASDTWLPTGWLIKDRGRSSDARPGLVDKYYVDPSSGRKFRSKKKVLYYLETGTPQPKRKKGTETPVVDRGLSRQQKEEV